MDFELDATLTKRRVFNKHERTIVYKKTGCRCGHCGKRLTDDNATVDHILPLSKGGLNDEYNLIGLCDLCNEDKSNFTHNLRKYYPYILDEYAESYVEYHRYAINKASGKKLFEYDETSFTVYPGKQQELLTKIYRRGGAKALSKLKPSFGVELILNKAYEGDACDILDIINKSIANKHSVIKSSLYTNEYAIIEDIYKNEVYVLREKTNYKIHGAFLFRHVNENDFNLPQLGSISLNSVLKPKYIMTGAYVDAFAATAYSDIMNSVMFNMLSNRAIPMYFNILNVSFKDVDSCISIPWAIDGVNSYLEFMPLKFIREMIGKCTLNMLEAHNDRLTPDEFDACVDLIINNTTRADVEKYINDGNANIADLLKSHEYILTDLFEPSACDLYANGFLLRKGRVTCL